MADSPRVLVVSSIAGLRQKVAGLLAHNGYLVDVSGKVSDAILRLELGASIVVVHLAVTDADPVDFVRDLTQKHPKLPVLALSARGESERIIAVVRAGALGCLYTDDVDDRLSTAIEEALEGGRPMSPGMGALFLEQVRRSAAARVSSRERRVVRPVTQREAAVLEQLARGLTYEDVARTMGVSVNTVRTFVRCIYEKLDVNSRTEAVVTGIRLGLVKRTPYPDQKPD